MRAVNGAVAGTAPGRAHRRGRGQRRLDQARERRLDHQRVTELAGEHRLQRGACRRTRSSSAGLRAAVRIGEASRCRAAIRRCPASSPAVDTRGLLTAPRPLTAPALLALRPALVRGRGHGQAEPDERGGAVRAVDHGVRPGHRPQPQPGVVVDGLFAAAGPAASADQVEQQIPRRGRDGRAVQRAGQRQLRRGGPPLLGLPLRLGGQPQPVRGRVRHPGRAAAHGPVPAFPQRHRDRAPAPRATTTSSARSAGRVPPARAADAAPG